MSPTFRQADDAAVRALQAWYGSDSYAASTGLYHWDDPNFASDVGGSAVAALVDAFGYHDTAQDTLRWWNSANAITALIDYMLVTNTDTYLWAVEHTFAQGPTAFTISESDVEEGAAAGALAGAAAGAAAGGALGGPLGALFGGAVGALAGALGGGAAAAATFARIYLTNFINPSGYYDDEGWWALAWLKAYDLTNDDKYLNMAVTIFNDMTNGWDRICNGGIYWAKNHANTKGNTPYKNAIANELFLAVGAGLYRRLRSRAPHWVYFMGTADLFQGADTKLWMVLDDGSQQSQIGNNTTASTPFVVPDPGGGAWVYFQGTDNTLWKVRDDGTQQSRIGNNTTASTPFVTADGWVYFQGTDNTLWKVFNDGTQQSRIGNNTTASTPFVVPDPGGGAWVYFQGTDNTLWKVRDDGTQQSRIGNNTTASTPFVTADGWVYFQGTDNTLWKVFNDGTQQSRIGNNTTASTPFVVPDPGGGAWVYFQGTDNTLWKVRDDGTQQSRIGNNTTASTPFVTADGWVYFQGTDNTLWKVFNDGTQQSRIGNNTTASTPFISSGGPSAFVDFLSWAEREWQWFDNSGLINSDNLINDALSTSASPLGPCQNDNEDVWTYNQGVILGALCDLAEITGNTSYLARAQKIADALIANHVAPLATSTKPPESGVDDGKILTEYTDITSSGPSQSIDNCQFKGIFVRNLATLCLKTPPAGTPRSSGGTRRQRSSS